MNDINNVGTWLKPSEFNETAGRLSRLLSLCFEASDGTKYWYEGTIPLLFKMVGFLGEQPKQKEKEETPAKNCRTCKYNERLGHAWPCIDCTMSMQNSYDRWEPNRK